MNKYDRARWKIHTDNLLREVLNNPGTGILLRPLQMLSRLLGLVAQRAIELNDPRLNAYMIMLTLYEQADPELEGYDGPLMSRLIEEGLSHEDTNDGDVLANMDSLEQENLTLKEAIKLAIRRLDTNYMARVSIETIVTDLRKVTGEYNE